MYDRFSGFNFKLVSPRRVKKIIEHCALYFVASMNKKKKNRREIPVYTMYRETFPRQNSRQKIEGIELEKIEKQFKRDIYNSSFLKYTI